MNTLLHTFVKFGIIIELKLIYLIALLKASYTFRRASYIVFNKKKIAQTITLIERKNWLYQRQRKPGNLGYATLKAITKDTSNAVNSVKPKQNDCTVNNL